MNLLMVNDSTFQGSIRQQGVTMVDFGAPWCPPCKVLKPLLDELGSEYGEKIALLEVNCDESPATASDYGIMSMPTVLVFNNGEPVEKLIGLRPKAVYENLIAKYI
ncbi:thioredoxin family protein [Cohnella mopanensis]|uniref:thioredoxin family protein n=1 Tax=Cohnella mopanensis TaxID=2911966 RepID=UPI001EF85A39|nr:thioredoxin domain-containing protein [Cohnella mopanensis]